MITINAIGDACPLPVIKVKNALKTNESVQISVDNEIATQNLEKMASQLGYFYHVERTHESTYMVTVGIADELNHVHRVNLKSQAQKDAYIVVIDNLFMGHGDDTLGASLMKAFIYSLTELDKLPSHVLFYNSGAYLTTKTSDVLDDLIQLKLAGVEILTCGACIDFFAIKEVHAVGEITNMYNIIQLMSTTHIVRP